MTTPDPEVPAEALPPRARLLRCGAGQAALALASPGILTPDGSLLLAVAGVALWALGAHRPGRAARRIEWLTAALGWSLVFGWSAYVFVGATVYMGASKALYIVLAGMLLRRLARRVPLALAVPAAYLTFETLCAVLPPPFGMPWMRLGTHAHAWEPLAGSARVWGVGGLSFALAAAAGLAAQLLAPGRPRPLGSVIGLRPLALGLGPLALGLALAAATSPPPMRPGPTVLLVQPGIPQERKMKERRDPRELLREAVELTARGLAEREVAGEPPPDLVAWAETMLYLPVMQTGLRSAIERGEAEAAPWLRSIATPNDVDLWRQMEWDWISGILVSGREPGPGRRGVLPPGTSFVSGAEFFLAHEGRLRRQNAVLLWNPDGTRGGAPDGTERVAAKVFLASSAETMHGLERFEWVRDVILELAGYVPDLLPAEFTETLWFQARDGRRYALGASICYDNAFDAPYLGPLRRGPLDFHLVLSNEAWFEESQEMDQMVAFSRLLAIQTGRALVRVTNAGVTCVLDARGRELARLVVAGRDRAVAGTLVARIPVPSEESGRTAETVYARTETPWRVLWIVLGPLLALLRRREKGGNRERPGG